MDGVFFAFIAIGLIRDNEGAVIENYPSSLIGEIRFNLQDKLLLGIILLPLLGEIWFDLLDMGFLDCPCYWPLGRTNWAPFLGQCQGPGRFTGLTFSLGLVSGPARLFLNPISCPSVAP